MNNEKEMLQKIFNIIGLLPQSIDIYYYIIKNGNIKKEKLLNEFNIDTDSLEKHINDLEKYLLITEDIDEEFEIIYWGLPLITAIEAIINLTDKKLSAEENKYLNSIKNIDLNIIPNDFNIRITNNLKICSTYICEAIDQANQKIYGITAPIEVTDSLIIRTYELKKDYKKINYKRISLIEEVYEYGCENRLIKLIQEVNLAFLVTIARKFYIVDDELTIFFWKDKNNSNLSGQSIKNKSLSQKYISIFEEYWKNTIPAKLILDEINRQKCDIMEAAKEKLSKKELGFLKSIISYGVVDLGSSKLPFSKDEQEKMIEKLKEYQYVVETNLTSSKIRPNFKLPL